MSEVTEKIPHGVVAILVSPDGNVIANASCFDRTTPGGFTMQEAQASRARDLLNYAVIKALSSPILSNAVSGYEASSIISAMRRNGCKIFEISIGYDED